MNAKRGVRTFVCHYFPCFDVYTFGKSAPGEISRELEFEVFASEYLVLDLPGELGGIILVNSNGSFSTSFSFKEF